MTATCAWRGCTAPGTGAAGFCHPHYRLQLRNGVGGLVDSAPVIAYVEALRELGWTFKQIGEAAGLWFPVPAGLLRDRQPRVRQATAVALLSVPLRPVSSLRSVSSVGSRRRVQALAWMGWPMPAVAREAGLSPRVVAKVYGPRVSYATARGVERVYDRWAGRQGPSRWVASKARRAGHAPPMAWDDAVIDDPAGRPQWLLNEPTTEGQGDLLRQPVHPEGS